MDAPLLSYSADDVNLQLAIQAHNGTSWVPERRGDQVVQTYLNHMVEIVEEFTKFVTDENFDNLAADLENYRVGYLRGLNAYLHAHSRVVSQMITGASGWTGQMIRAHEKRNDTCDRRLNEWLAWREKALSRMRRKYNPRLIAKAPITAGDPDAVEKLQKKIDRLQHYQDLMKAANKVIRGKGLTDEQKMIELRKLGLTEGNAYKAMQPDYMGRLGFPTYELSNNSANIRQLKQRITSIEAEQGRRDEQGDEHEYEINGVRVVESATDDRIRVYLEREQVEYRQRLKSRGFNWSRQEVAWQRQLTHRARADVKWALEG